MFGFGGYNKALSEIILKKKAEEKREETEWEILDKKERRNKELRRLHPSNRCPRCGREITNTNRYIDNDYSCCEGCQEDGMRNFVLFDIISRFF
jgi:hypothetical protein